MERNSKLIIIISTICLLIVIFLGTSYAFFGADIIGLESASTISLEAGRMEIVYSEGNDDLYVPYMTPRAEEWITKNVTITAYNSTQTPMYYELGLQVITNTFAGGQLTYSLEHTSGTNGDPIDSIESKVVLGSGTYQRIGVGSFVQANGEQHQYVIKIFFKDNGRDQSFNQRAQFNAKATVKEATGPIAYNSENSYTFEIDNNSAEVVSYDIDYAACTALFQTEPYASNTTKFTPAVIESICTSTDGNYTSATNARITIKSALGDDFYNIITNQVYDYTKIRQGYKITHGPYTYSYKQVGAFTGTSLFMNVAIDGWGVILTDKTSTDPVTEAPLVAINGIPVSLYASLFKDSQATSIDLSGFITSEVLNMSYMFYNCAATSLDLSSFDTSRVTTFSYMFANSSATSLNLSSFDTSNVAIFSYMFSNSDVTSLDVSNFDTSKATAFSGMFKGTSFTSLDVSNFNTSKVATYYQMFAQSHITDIDVSNFDTVIATTYNSMFEQCGATTITLGPNFITNAGQTFTSMFKNSTSLTTIYAYRGFSNQNIVSNGSTDMFLGCTSIVGGAGTVYTPGNNTYASGRRIGYAHIDKLDNPGYFTSIKDKPTS